MTDWSKLKVADLKEECKSRGIPLTGLKLKQQYVDKLAEHEAQDGGQSNETTDAPELASVERPAESHVNGESVEPDRPMSGVNDDDDNNSRIPEKTNRTHKPDESQGDNKRQELQTENQPEESLGETGVDEAQQRARAKPKVREQPQSRDEAAAEDALLVPEPVGIEDKIKETGKEIVDATEQDPQPTAPVKEDVSAGDAVMVDQNGAGQKYTLQSTPESTQILSTSSTPFSALQQSDISDDQRKRRKRSTTPVPSSEEIARKKVKLNDDDGGGGAEGLIQDDALALEQMKAGTETAKEIVGQPPYGVSVDAVVSRSAEGVATTTEPQPAPVDTAAPEIKTTDKMPSPRGPRSLSEDRDVPPAIHPATSAIYIRNFKRPLHIPSLRSHIVSIAKSRSSDDSDPITIFYLDSIRTHAFVAFTSVTAASRVRSAMHETRFPDEPLRELLFVDYVPDNKVQSWIDQETGGGFGRGGSGRRFEVVYEEGENGIEAIFQEVDTSKPRPPLEPSRSSRMSIDRPKPEALPPGVHPDRAGLIPRDRRDGDRDWPRAPPTGPKNSSSSGAGFKALDELFASTSAKPKLYYKPVSDSVAEERLDMFRDLRMDYANMGRSGDEGMKRYSFEKHKDREEWVDKGPEFGYGKRGQARLIGSRPLRGGFRGRGDSWRGGGR